VFKALVIGCGNIGALYDLHNEEIQSHVKALYLDNRFSVSIFDLNKNLTCDIAKKYNCNVVNTVNEDTLAAFDLVSICTPTLTHCNFLKMTFAAKVKLVICEKPVSNNMNELDDLAESYSKHHTKVLVNYIRRFQPSFIYLKDLFQGMLKTEVLTNINIRYQKGFVNNCSHAFDLLEYLLDSEISLIDIKIHNIVFDHFPDDPTLSLLAIWNGTNVNVHGLNDVFFSHFEIDLYFTTHKICITESGHTIKVYKSIGILSPLKIQNELTRVQCLQDYMKHVIDHAYCLLNQDITTDNFIQSVNLNKIMLKIL